MAPKRQFKFEFLFLSVPQQSTIFDENDGWLFWKSGFWSNLLQVGQVAPPQLDWFFSKQSFFELGTDSLIFPHGWKSIDCGSNKLETEVGTIITIIIFVCIVKNSIKLCKLFQRWPESSSSRAWAWARAWARARAISTIVLLGPLNNRYNFDACNCA